MEVLRKKKAEELIKEAHDQNPYHIDHIETEKEFHKNYIANIMEATERGKKLFPKQDFFVVVLTKWEKALHTAFRKFYFPRLSCPKPTPDQTLYQYTYNGDKLEFIWVVPDRETIDGFLRNKIRIDKDYQQLLYFILSYTDGSLDRKCNELNKGMPSPLITIESEA